MGLGGFFFNAQTNLFIFLYLFYLWDWCYLVYCFKRQQSLNTFRVSDVIQVKFRPLSLCHTPQSSLYLAKSISDNFLMQIPCSCDFSFWYVELQSSGVWQIPVINRILTQPLTNSTRKAFRPSASSYLSGERINLRLVPEI